MWYIVDTSDGKRYPITAIGLTIGREGCAILTPASDSRASRQHAMVRLRGDGIEVQDLESTNGTYIDEQRLGTTTAWAMGQVLRCGQTTFQLIADPPVSLRSAPTIASTAGMTMAIPATYPDRPAAPAQMAPPAAQSIPPRLPPPPSFSTPPLSAPVGNQYQQPVGAVQRPPATSNASAIFGLIFGIVMLIAGIIGWQHYQPQMNNINSMLGQFVIGFGGESVAREAEQTKLYYTGSIVVACVGGITMLASAIRLAVSRN